ncbi:MAG: right-handed parallel beta-helix repeat-containing protein [Verrucomicrobiae bacterium]|nr:right-handed parallel beta-helix repeat-containing protein [Verrucomicrobiae bacterium]
MSKLLQALPAMILAGIAHAVEIPTSLGNGADAYLSNDSNRGPAVTHGTKAFFEIRQFPDTRLRIAYLRFDISEVVGDLSGATITITGTTVPESLPLFFHGLNESPFTGAGEAWDEAAINYATASGLDPSAPLATFALTSDATSSPLAVTTGSAVGANTTVPNAALDAFLAADTDGLVTFIAFIDPAVITPFDHSFTFSSKEGSGAPVLTLPNAMLPSADDLDGDLLRDLWEDFHFGNADGLTDAAERALVDGGDDPDEDGFDNEAEETAHTDPNDGDAYPGGPQFLYVSPTGDDGNTGTIDEPFATVARAQQDVAAGGTIYFRGGTHAIDVGQVARYSSVFAYVFDLDKDGTESQPIRYWAYPGEEPVFDLSAVNPAGYRIYTLHITGDWLHFRGLTVTGVQVNITTHTQSICFENFGSHNLFERLVMRDNQAIGMWIASGSSNLVLNCDAYRNWDYTSENGNGGNVDGFGCHYTIGPGNVFRGCRAWFNSDDGYDLINAQSAVTIEHCWAAYNGYDFNFNSRGDGNGFKAGGYGKPPSGVPATIPRHVVRGCLAVGNKQAGFYANHHPGGLTFIGNTGLRNRRNFNLLNWSDVAAADVPGYDHILRNNVGIHATTGNLTDVDLPACDSSNNQWDLAVTADAADFQSIDESFLTAPRQTSGELPVVPLMRLEETSDLIDAGADVGEPFAGTAPDLGCHESEAIEIGNHSFSLPPVTAAAAKPKGHVWTFQPGAGVKPGASGQVAFATGNGSFAQTLDGFIPGGTYHIHLVASAPAGSPSLALAIDGNPVSTRTVNGTVSIDSSFVATLSQHSLRISATGSAEEVQVSLVRITRVTSASDSDHDTLRDQWEFSWFGNLQSSADSDSDHDGSNDAVEQALGLDPTSGADFFHCDMTGDGVLEWPSASGIDFTVWRSGNLVDWDDIAIVPGLETTTSFIDPSPPEGGAFYRVSFGP